ncbi:restriction endonuclease subunit S [Jeotgalicoccus sp. S0W5]|uniref:restriction endonuclease subunit S n=1 Tax=Jeotgalicoccus sp. S0W5 TaxID=2527874 RepID=UPI002110C49E|nr:restriction endonuclease subunit S [Jeotgalicoccus sp. S0W5]
MAWEQRQLNDVVKFSKGKFYSKNDLVEDGNEVILYGQLYTNYQTAISYSDTKVIPKPNSVYSIGKEVIIPSSGESAEDISIASSIIASGIIIAGDLNILTPLNTLNNTFLALALSNGKSKKELSKYAQGKSIVHLHGKDFRKLILKYPNLNEQIKIKEFVLRLDNLINLHQRKISKLLKLQQQFSKLLLVKSSHDNLKLRFKYFKSKWVLHKLSELAPLRGGYAFKSNEFQHQGIPIIRISNILSNGKIDGDFVYSKKLSRDNHVTLSENDILIAMSGATTGKTAIIQENHNRLYYQNQRVGYFTKLDGVSYEFINVLVKSALFNIQLKSVLVAGAQPNISAKDIDNFEFYIPEQDEERKLIGQLYNNVTKIIQISQKRLDSLMLLKKEYLNKIFI